LRSKSGKKDGIRGNMISKRRWEKGGGGGGGGEGEGFYGSSTTAGQKIANGGDLEVLIPRRKTGGGKKRTCKREYFGVGGRSVYQELQ